MWAGEVTRDTDVVLDAACGTGYGQEFLKGRYIGVDKIGPHPVDLETWVPGFDFDVFVGIETVEHLHDYSTYVEVAKKAKRATVISTPIVPTVWINEFHVHDFTKQEIVDLFTDDTWQLSEYEEQSFTYGLFLFERT